MIIKITRTGQVTQVQPQVVRIVRVYDHPVPAGILETAYTQKGGIIVGTGSGTYAEQAPGSSGQYLEYDTSSPTGVKASTPSIAISDATNFLINGGFDFAQRTTPGTLTTVNDNAYGADRWKQTRENAALQYQRNSALSETGLTSRYYGKYKKITNAGKFMVFQILEGQHTVPLRGKTVIFQAKLKASSSKTIRMGVIQLQAAGSMDVIPSSFVSAWNVDSTDPTLGSNLAVITGAESKSVTTSWTNFTVSVTIPGDAKNIICAMWTDADFSVSDELNIAEAGLFLGSTSISWTPRNITQELLLCQRYYQKSYDIDTVPSTNTGLATLFCIGFSTQYCTPMDSRIPVPFRTIPTVTIISMTGTSGKISTLVGVDAGTGTITQAIIGAHGLLTDPSLGFTAGTQYRYHFTAEADL